MQEEENYWSAKYKHNTTGWDIGHPATPLKSYIDQVEDKSIKILVPGAGNGYEAEYLWKKGFQNVSILDISEFPLHNFEERNPTFPKAQIIHGNFFEHQGLYDLILEQTFFCSMVPTKQNRTAYAKKMAELLRPNGKLVGVWFNFPLTGDMETRPFGGSKAEYALYFNPYFETMVFEPCHNSIPPRQGNELFGIFKKRKKR